MRHNLIPVLMALIIVVPVISHAKCNAGTTIKQLAKAGVDGEKAFSDMDLESLLSHSTRAREDVLPCLSEKVTTRDAAAFHRLMAFEAFTRQNNDRVIAEFHAARKLDPGYEIPDAVADKDHPLRKLYDKAMMAADGKLEIVYSPKDGYVTVGGVRNAPRPSMTPVIIQVFDSTGMIQETRYLQPGETLPAWGRNPMGITAKDLDIDTRSGWTRPTGWYITAGVLAVTAGVLYGVAMDQKASFNDPSTADGELSGYRATANGLGTASIVTGGLAIILGGVGAGLHISFGGEEDPVVKPIAMPVMSGLSEFGHVRVR